jgi:hypothetical protein
VRKVRRIIRNSRFDIRDSIPESRDLRSSNTREQKYHKKNKKNTKNKTKQKTKINKEKAKTNQNKKT